jgi:hypothetical protein
MDHATRLVYIRCIPNVVQVCCLGIEPNLWSDRLPRHIASQTWNGREFTAQVILDLSMNSKYYIVADSDHGSVRSNATTLVKRLISNQEETERQNGEVPNWTMMQGRDGRSIIDMLAGEEGLRLRESLKCDTTLSSCSLNDCGGDTNQATTVIGARSSSR